MPLTITKFTFNMFCVNTYIISDTETKKCIIIDPGMMNNNENTILSKFITENNLSPQQLINTHLHIDHVMGNEYVSTTYGLTPYCHKNDSFLGERIEQQISMFGLPIKIKNIEKYNPLSEGDNIEVGNEILKIIHLPGHSPGSIILHSETYKFIISGDVLFQHSIGRTDLPGGDYSTLINNIQNKLLSLPEDTKVYPGHGTYTTIGNEKLHNPFL